MHALDRRRHARFVFFDFEEVQSISEPAAEELYAPHAFSAVFINATPEVARTLRRAAATVG